MAQKSYTTDDVYGLNRDLPLNYVARQSVDHTLIENLTRQKHLVIYGSSKQGKTSLRKHCLQSDDCIVIQCSNKWTLVGLHEAILKAAGYSLTQSTTKSVSGSVKVVAKASAMFLGTGGKGGFEADASANYSTTSAPLELDPSDVNDLLLALKAINFNKYIVLEDFHYLTNETQRDFSVALKAIHEGSTLTCIVIGVWLEENRLIVLNGDLTGRLVPIDADRWTSDELTEVITKGAEFLNITFADRFIYRLLGEAYSSVFFVQEACRRVCRAENVFERQPSRRLIGEEASAADIISTIVNEQGARYRSFLRQFADGFQDSELQMFQWVLLPVICSDPKDLQLGLTYPYIRKLLQSYHPAGATLKPGNITMALQKVGGLQIKKQIKPIILDYDDTNRRLRVVDRGFLIWLERQDQRELLEYCGFEESVRDAVLSEPLDHDDGAVG